MTYVIILPFLTFLLKVRTATKLVALESYTCFETFHKKVKQKLSTQVIDIVVSEAESKKDSEWQDKIRKIEQSLRKYSEIKARKWSNVCTVSITLICIAILVLAYLEIPSEILSLILTVTDGGGFIELWTKGRSKLRSTIFERMYQQKIKEARLTQI
jgi:hypothetical protein